MADNKSLTFLVTVTYRCENMITQQELDEEYGGDPLEAYRGISDNFNDSPANFGDKVRENVKVAIE